VWKLEVIKFESDAWGRTVLAWGGLDRAGIGAWSCSRIPQLYTAGWRQTARILFGFMIVTIEFANWSVEPFACMDCLYIREPYRVIGIGRTFLGHLRGFCAARGYRLAEWQIPVDNTLGIGFCQRMGARAMPRIRFRCGIDPQEAAC